MPLIIDLGLKEEANKLGLGSFDPKLYRLVKGNAKTENYSILTGVLLKEGPRPTGRDGPAARRPEGLAARGPRPPAAGWPSPDFPQFFCPAANPRARTDLHLVWACKL